MGRLTDQQEREVQVVLSGLHNLMSRCHMMLATGRVASRQDEEAIALADSLAKWCATRHAGWATRAQWRAE